VELALSVSQDSQTGWLASDSLSVSTTKIHFIRQVMCVFFVQAARPPFFFSCDAMRRKETHGQARPGNEIIAMRPRKTLDLLGSQSWLAPPCLGRPVAALVAAISCSSITAREYSYPAKPDRYV
jgi:hypothetical protein